MKTLAISVYLMKTFQEMRHDFLNDRKERLPFIFSNQRQRLMLYDRELTLEEFHEVAERLVPDVRERGRPVVVIREVETRHGENLKQENENGEVDELGAFNAFLADHVEEGEENDFVRIDQLFDSYVNYCALHAFPIIEPKQMALKRLYELKPEWSERKQKKTLGTEGQRAWVIRGLLLHPLDGVLHGDNEDDADADADDGGGEE